MNTDSAFGYNCIECNENIDFKYFYFNKTKNEGYKKCISENVKGTDCEKFMNNNNSSDQKNRKHKIKDEIENDIVDNNNIINNRTLIVGHCFCGKTYLMLKIQLEKEKF